MNPVGPPVRDTRNLLRIGLGAVIALVVIVTFANQRPVTTATTPAAPSDATVTAAMQAAIARELPSWRGIIAETGGKPDVAANGTILYVATTLASTQTDGLNDLCDAVAVWARSYAPSLRNVSVIRNQRPLTDCRV